MGLADRDYVKDLHALLRISRHLPDDELRYAYEQAMSAATRSGDLVRARTLSGAYEEWSRQRGAGVFGRTFATSNAPVAPPRAGGRTTSRPRRAPRPRKWGMSLPVRVLYVLIVVPAAVLTAVQWITHPPTDGTNLPMARQVQPATYPTTSPPRPESPKAARADLREAVAAVGTCRHHGVRLPRSTRMQSGRAVLTCGRKVIVIHLHRGDRLRFARTGRRAYRVVVVARSGEVTQYDSRTGMSH